MLDKRVKDADEAVRDVAEGASILMGGFGLCGIPENLIRALCDTGVKGLTLISNNPGSDRHGIGLLLARGQVRKMILSFGGYSKTFEGLVKEGRIEVEWVPQGTLAERIRAAGAGIGGFYTPTGVGTVVAEGKEARELDGKTHVLELPLRADFAFVKAHKGDPYGNLVYRRTARNFNQTMATAGRTVIAEVEELVELGGLHPEHIHTPGLYVHRLFKGAKYEKPIEKLTVRPRESVRG